MKHLDLGGMDEDVLLFGGPYSNIQALEAVLARADDAGIRGDRIICTGDVVAYCGAPQACVDRLQAAGCSVIAGNCEIQIAQGVDDCGCGFEEGTTCDRLSVAWYAHARAHLAAPARAWMAGLPDLLSFEHHGKRYGVLHGGVRDVARFVWETNEDAVFAREWAALEAEIGPVDAIIAGHCGIPFLKLTARGPWINAGVIGMPPHDGAPQTRFAMLSEGQIRIERLTYDVEGAVEDMQAAGLPSEYRDALQSGYWPSEDVLPEALRSAVSESG